MKAKLVIGLAVATLAAVSPNRTVRLYRPRPEILDGTWKFPEPRPAS